MTPILNLLIPPELRAKVLDYAQQKGLKEEQALIDLLALALGREAPAPSEPTTPLPDS